MKCHCRTHLRIYEPSFISWKLESHSEILYVFGALGRRSHLADDGFEFLPQIKISTGNFIELLSPKCTVQRKQDSEERANTAT